MDNYCYKPSPDTANCVQNISWKGACNPGDETYDMVYSWINTVTKEYYRGCDKEGYTAAGCLLKMPCPSVMKLSFFDLKNIAITVMLLIAVYFVYATARRK